MFANQYEEHLASQPDNSRWDGFDRGDCEERDSFIDQGSRVIGRMTSVKGQRVVLTEFWCDDWRFYEVKVDGLIVLETEDDDMEYALAVARQWREGILAQDKDTRIDGYNVEFLGAKPAKAGEDY